MQFVWALWALLEAGQEFGVQHPFKTIFPNWLIPGHIKLLQNWAQLILMKWLALWMADFPLLSLLPENFETQQQCSVSFQILEENGKGDDILKSSILKSLGWMHISVTWWPLLDLSSVRLVPASRRIFWGMQKLNWIMFPSPDLSDYKLDLLFSITSCNFDTDFKIKCPLNESRYVSKSIQV